MAECDIFSHGIEMLSTTSRSLDGKLEEPPSYTTATQHPQHIREGPGDLPPSSQPSPKVLRYKLEEPQVPATARKMKKLLNDDNIIKIYSCSPGRQNVAIAQAESDLFEYFSGNVIDWTNSTLGVCDDSVSIYLVDWMKAGGMIPTEGPSSVAYWEKDLEWLEQLYTIAGNLWMRKLMKQTAKEIDRFTGNDKRMHCLAAERKKRESTIKEAVKQQARASKEANEQKKWLAKILTDEQKDLLDLDSLDVNDHEARLLIAETHQREKAEKSLAKQQERANKQLAKQRRKMEKALTEQFRKDKSAALMLRCKRLVGSVGYTALKLVGGGILAVGGLALLLVDRGLLILGKVAFKTVKLLSLGVLVLLSLVFSPITVPIVWVIRKILSASDY